MKNKIVLFIVGILFVVILIPFSPISQAEMEPERTVDPSDSIQEAINNASAGEIILITPGTYHQMSIIVNKSVTLVGENVETAILDAEEKPGAIFVVRADGVKIQNLTLRHTALSGGVAVRVDSVSNVEISDSIIEQCDEGIELDNSTGCVIARNTIKDVYSRGIHLHRNSSYNYIIGNTIKNNPIGVYLPSTDPESEKNVLYHNNFIANGDHQKGLNNVRDYWNNTYPFGGNYWDNYAGVDLYDGPLQDQAGSDGIGDTNYTIYLDKVDYYPLMAPVHFFNAGRWDTRDYCVAVASNLNVSNFNFNPDEEPPFIQFDLAGQNGNFCRVTIPRQLLWTAYPYQWQVLLGESEATTLILEDYDYTYIYFNFSYDGNTETAKIIGTYAIPEFPKPIFLILIITLLTAVIIAKKCNSP